jgi:hypothetical protein
MNRLLLLACALVVALLCLSPALPAQTPHRADPVSIRSDLDDIYSRAEFRAETDNGENALTHFMKWLKKQWDAFWEKVRDLFKMERGRGAMGGGGNGLQWIFIAIFLVIAAYVLAILLKAFLRYRAGREASKRTAFEFDEAEADTITEPDVWMDQAEHFARESDFRRAFRAVFLATLLRLDRAGAIHFDRARTNGDYLRHLRADGWQEIVRVFGPLVIEFDQRWYGNRATAEADYRRGLTMQTQIIDLLKTPKVTGDESKRLEAQQA